ncbi:MAG TPA: hypothetical protein VGE47_00830, partial [Burkholderiaceae bacterium]
MPRSLKRSLIAAAALACSTLALADAPATPEKAPIANSDMDAPLFYQLLIGEIELRNGQPGLAFQVLLDAARRSGDGALYQRVVAIALNARAGDQALLAARAWAETNPKSAEAQQACLQLLALLNRPTEAAEPLRALLALRPEVQRPALIASLPQLFARSPEPKKVFATLDPVLRQQGEPAPVQLAALLARGRLALSADARDVAFDLAREAARLAPDSDEPAQLALELLPKTVEAEALVRARLTSTSASPLLRLGWARALA